ncbi:hypothetical protein N7450_011095, partial [Penicillium hetheringtonii]
IPNERNIFNLPELKRLAAQSIGKTENDITGFQKLAEGGFNRTFIITMQDGFQFVARIPFPVTEPKALLIGSEVATMDYLRSHGLPIPRVFGYSTITDNPAGTEYIFMELVQGTSLGDVWFDLSEQQQTTIITNLVQLESKLLALKFPAGGSLYYSDDLPDKYPRVPLENETTSTMEDSKRQFCIGPDTSFRLWFGKRLTLDVERGPYRDSFAALTAGASKEIKYLEEFGKPLVPFQRLRRELYAYKPQSHLEHLQNLKKYLAIAPYLIPTGPNTYLQRPVIRHPDLQPNNVIVTEDLDVKGLIDWQYSTILPLFLQSGVPLSIRSQGIIEPWKQPAPPLKPSKIGNNVSKKERLHQEELARKGRLHHEYIKKTAEFNPEHDKALSERFNKLRRRLWHHVNDPWEGDVVTLKADLIVLSRKWGEITGHIDSDIDSDSEVNDTCPISFSKEEIKECLRLNAAQADADDQLKECQDIIGVCSEGWTPSASFEKAKAREKKLKAETFEAVETEEERKRLKENWIFDDFCEDDYI